MARNLARKSVKTPIHEIPDTSLIAGNVRIHDRRTSVRLEPEMWSALYEIAELEDISIHEVCAAVDDCKMPGESFSSSLRVFLLKYYRQVARGRKTFRFDKRDAEKAAASGQTRRSEGKAK
jgi:predicted DNA-binding ribbon-helix-helix protein